MRRACIPALLTVLLGCSYGSASSTTTPVLPYDYVVGPHGEPLVQVQCFAPSECMSAARQACGGDFDVVVSSFVSTSHGGWPAMLVGCLRPPDAGPPELRDGGQ